MVFASYAAIPKPSDLDFLFWILTMSPFSKSPSTFVIPTGSRLAIFFLSAFSAPSSIVIVPFS